MAQKKFGIQNIYGIDSKLKSKIASNGKNGIDYFCTIEGEQHCKKVQAPLQNWLYNKHITIVNDGSTVISK
jgi:hypothetical protein